MAKDWDSLAVFHQKLAHGANGRWLCHYAAFADRWPRAGGAGAREMDRTENRVEAPGVDNSCRAEDSAVSVDTALAGGNSCHRTALAEDNDALHV